MILRDEWMVWVASLVRPCSFAGRVGVVRRLTWPVNLGEGVLLLAVESPAYSLLKALLSPDKDNYRPHLFPRITFPSRLHTLPSLPFVRACDARCSLRRTTTRLTQCERDSLFASGSRINPGNTSSSRSASCPAANISHAIAPMTALSVQRAGGAM